MKPPRQTREWSWKEFKRLYPHIPHDALRHIHSMCNVAIREGLTRNQVVDTFAKLSKDYPDELPPVVAVEALVAAVDRVKGRPQNADRH